MDINNNQQVNTFIEGMNTDTSDTMIKETQYRYAENLRLITNSDSNSGELRLIEGINEISIVDEQDRPVKFFNVIASTNIRDIGIIIEKNASERWSVYRIDHKNDKYIANQVFGPCSSGKDWPKHKLSLVTRYEDSDNIKLYIADGENYLMCLNIAKDCGNEIQQISSAPEYTFGGFKSIEKTSGSLKPALVQYAYILYDKYGKSSSLSPLSKLCVVESINKGLASNEISTQGFKIIIDENNSIYNIISGSRSRSSYRYNSRSKFKKWSTGNI